MVSCHTLLFRTLRRCLCFVLLTPGALRAGPLRPPCCRSVAGPRSLMAPCQQGITRSERGAPAPPPGRGPGKRPRLARLCRPSRPAPPPAPPRKGPPGPVSSGGPGSGMSDVVERTLSALPGLLGQHDSAAGPGGAGGPGRVSASSRLGSLIRSITALTSKHVRAAGPCSSPFPPRGSRRWAGLGWGPGRGVSG